MASCHRGSVSLHGYLNLTSEHSERLKALSAACGGWIRFDDNLEEVFVPVAQWLEQHYEPKRAGI